jgi:hypothetical protein
MSFHARSPTRCIVILSNTAMSKEPSEELRKRVAAYLKRTETAVSKLSTETGIGVYKLHRWLAGTTTIISYNDAVKLSTYLSQGEA